MTSHPPAAHGRRRRRSTTVGAVLAAVAVAVGAAAVCAGCRTATPATAGPTPLVTTTATPPDTASGRHGAGCAELMRVPNATPQAAIDARWTVVPGTPAAVFTPERLPHIQYTYDSQSTTALGTYLRQWRDSTAGRTEAEVMALPPLERAAHEVYAAFRFGPDAPSYRPDPPPDGVAGDRPSPADPDSYVIVPTVIEVGCVARVRADEASAVIGSKRFGGAQWVYLGDFRPPSPAPERTLYLTEAEALALHHYLGVGWVREPPLGAVAVAPLSYAVASGRLDWLRRALPIHGSVLGGELNLLTPPVAVRIVLDIALTHAVVDYRSGPYSGGSAGLTRSGTAWRITERYGDWIW